MPSTTLFFTLCSATKRHQKSNIITMTSVAPPPPPPPSTKGDLSRIQPQPSFPANPTIYLSNIDWSIKKPLLKRALYSLFTRHGKVLDVIVLRGNTSRNRPLRGQAWVIMESVSAASAALSAVHHFNFFNRPLVANYAKTTSDRIAKRDGTFQKIKGKRRHEDDGHGSGGDAKMAKREDTAASTASTSQSSGPQPSNVPTSTLLTSTIPPECNEMMLAMLFKQYSGYKAVKSHGGRIYTVSFETEGEATAALKGLNGFKLDASSVLDLKYGQ
jgi:U2 small nuclear ribonucleoprotein B''